MSKIILIIISILLLSFSQVLASPTFVFSDVPAGHWAYEAVSKLAKEGIIEGYRDNTFKGGQTITRYEMAMIIANSISKEDKANAQQKAIIEKLTTEFSNELAQLGVRLAKLEAKAKVNFLFDNRIQTNVSSLSPTDGGAWGGGNVVNKSQTMERLRIWMNASVGDEWQWDARLKQQKDNIRNQDSEARFDLFWVTNNNFLNTGAKLEMGKIMLIPGKGAFFANLADVDGVMLTIPYKSATYKMGSAQMSSEEIRWVEAQWKLSPTADIGAYLLRHSTDKDMRVFNGAVGFSNGLALSAEYAKNKAPGPYNNKNGYFVALQSKYEAANMAPGIYTSMVNPFVKGDHGWAVSYRKLESGVAGAGNIGAFCTWTPFSVDTNGTWQNGADGVKASRLDYLWVPWKNVMLTLTYDHIKPIEGNWTNNSFQSTFNFIF